MRGYRTALFVLQGLVVALLVSAATNTARANSPVVWFVAGMAAVIFILMFILFVSPFQK